MAISLTIASAGCKTESRPELPASQRFVAQTSGSPEALFAHVDHLKRLYDETESTNPAAAREDLMAYTQAVIDTTGAIVDDRTAPDAARETAADLHLKFLGRQSEIDPKALDKTVAACERIMEQNPKTRVANIAALERTRVIGFLFQTSPLASRPKGMERLAEAVKSVPQLVPPPPNAPDLVNKTAQDAEWYRRPDLAESLYNLFLERYPDSERAPFVRGALDRIKHRGQVVTDLKGPGRGGKETSLEDFRGKVVLVHFWGTGSTQSVEELAELEMLRSRLEPKGFVVLGVSLDPDQPTIEEGLKREKIDWPQIFSPVKDQSLASPLTLKFGVQRAPFKLLIDREGKLVDTGFLLEQIQPSIDALFATKEEGQGRARRRRNSRESRFFQIVLACATRPVYISGQRLSW